MTGGYRFDGPGAILSEAIGMAAEHPVLMLACILPSAIEPFIGLDLVTKIISMIDALLLCGIYGSFTTCTRGDSEKGIRLFASSMGKFILRYIGMALIFTLALFAILVVVYLPHAKQERLVPTILTVGYPLAVLVTISMGIMFNKDTGVFSAFGEMFGYLTKVWPVFIILGVTVPLSLVRYFMFGNEPANGFEKVVFSASSIIGAFLDLLGFLYVTVYLLHEKDMQAKIQPR